MRTKALRGAACGVILIVLACALPAAPAAERSVMRPWPSSQPAPAFAITDLSGKQWKLADLRGKVVVLNFWASWCSPCVEELPILNKLAADAADKVVVLGVNYKEASWSVDRFTQAHAFGYPVLLDKNGEHFTRWTNGVMPTTVLIGRDGKPRWRVIGAIAPGDESFQVALNKLLAQ
jgi:thiol-disulfide isomerase/thioredoxin